MITADQLAEAQARVNEARAAVRPAAAARDELVRQAAREGWGQRAIARALDVSQPTVREIITPDIE